ncbi:MAG: response regulator transcription factor [Bacteroidales bacterium]|nr:response regulator transcription factor [Bacteroidales bacterium]
MENYKIILADDHQLFRDGIKSLLLSEEHIDIIGEFCSGNELLQFLEAGNTADIVISDISMPDLSGLDLTKILTEKYPDVKVIILSMHINEEYILEAIESGAKGYLPKDTNREELLEAIAQVTKGNEYFSKEVSQIALKSFIQKSQQKSKEESPIATLTERELEIIKLVAEGYMNKEISDQLNISTRTVDNHKAHILQKLNLKSSIDIVKFAIKNEIIRL